MNNSQFKNICPKCFHNTLYQGKCQHCQYTIPLQITNHDHLPFYTILNHRYLIGIVIGQGGFGITYRSYDLKLDQLCVIKEYYPRFIQKRRHEFAFLTQDQLKDFKHGMKRFEEEANILLKISQKKYHYIVNVYDYFKENNTCYYVMQYIHGATLKSLQGKYRFSVQELTDIIIKIGSDLDRIHNEEHILHRDISPENIIIMKDNTPILLDFGSAKTMSRDQNYTVVLKQNFAPLEQYSTTKAQGPYTDVYSLAATYYYLLTGSYVPKATDQIISNVEVPALESFNVGVSPQISQTVQKALALQSQDRFKTMKEFIDGLKEIPKIQNIQGKPVIKIIDRHNKVRKFYLKENQLCKVGRGTKNDLDFQYKAVSKNHLIISYDMQKQMFQVKETSRNGTFINDQFVYQETNYYQANTIIQLPEIKEIIILEVES